MAVYVSDGRTFYSFHGELLSKNMAQEDNSTDDMHLLFGVFLQT